MVQPALPMSPEQWETGLNLDQFVLRMKHKAEDMRRRLAEVTLTPAQRGMLTGLNRAAHVLVMTEDWCGDSLMNVPILVRVVDSIPGMDMRFFIRHECADLRLYYEERGIHTIPVFTFFDKKFEEIGTWVERPQAAHLWRQAWLARHPERDAIQCDPTLTEDERRARLQEIAQIYQKEMEEQYRRELQTATVAELARLLAAGRE